MKTKQLCTIMLSLLILFSFCPTTHAYLQRVYFDVFTTNQIDRQYVGFWVEIRDTESKNPPDVVKSIKVTAPDDTVFEMTTTHNWYSIDKGYYAAFTADEFNSQVIPDGIYRVEVKAYKWGLTITQEDYCDATLLDLPVITDPIPGSTVGANHVFWWTAVAGASYYRVQLREAGSDNFIYGDSSHKHRFLTALNACIFPLGDLKPDRHYEIRVEPRNDTLDMDKRSRGDWVEFFTSHWE
jgi:hypothetical protein